MTTSSYASGQGASSLSPPALIVRRRDPDRFLTALFAPADRRETLFALYAFNHELARAREAVSEPTLALIRLQWWREVVEGASRRHEVAEPLAAALARGELVRGDLLGMIDAREVEAEPTIPTLADWRAYLLGTAGGLAVAAGRLLGAPQPEALRPLGAAYGVAGVLRGVPVLARQRRSLLPVDVLAAQGLSPEAAIADPFGPPGRGVAQELANVGKHFLAEAGGLRLPRFAVAAALPAVFARRDLSRPWPPVAGPRSLADRLAVTRAGLTGRL
jgi:15-cis-phytoene synthase